MCCRQREGFCILHMLRIHTGLRRLSKTNLNNRHLKTMNPFGIHEPCIKIEKNELLFEQYRMALNQEKYDIEVRNDDTIKCNRTLFDFMKWTFNYLDGLYLRHRCILIHAITKDQMRNQSAAEIEKLNREKIPETKERRVHLSLLQKNPVL